MLRAGWRQLVAHFRYSHIGCDLLAAGANSSYLLPLDQNFRLHPPLLCFNFSQNRITSSQCSRESSHQKWIWLVKYIFRCLVNRQTDTQTHMSIPISPPSRAYKIQCSLTSRKQCHDVVLLIQPRPSFARLGNYFCIYVSVCKISQKVFNWSTSLWWRPSPWPREETIGFWKTSPRRNDGWVEVGVGIKILA